jgi:nucleoside phosphorylase
MAVHVFAHADGPHVGAAWQQVRAIWSRCRFAGLTEAVAGLGVPADLPDTSPGDTVLVVAVCQSRDTHRQAVLRVEHDVLVVSLLVAPPDGAWADGERELAELVGDQPDPGVFGVAWLYLGKAADPRAALASPGDGSGWDTGTELELGVAARETSDRVATRVVRRLQVLATPDRDARLGEWTWSDTTPRMPRLARYLMHLAKVRYEARVHAGFPGVGPLCRAVESSLAGQQDAADRTRLAELVVEIIPVLMAVRMLLRTVEIARYNAALALDADAPVTASATLFGDDEAFVRDLLLRLDDDRAYLENALDAARTVTAIADNGPTRARRPTSATPAPTRLPTFGIVTALPEEFGAMRVLLDPPIERRHVADDPANYLIGTLPSAIDGQPHTVVLTMLGETANNAAAAGTANLTRSFGTVNCVVMVGIAAGVPNPAVPHQHVRLGDVVVATWGVIDYDHVVDTPHGRLLRQSHPRPSPLLGHAAKFLVAGETAGARPWDGIIDDAWTRLPVTFARPDPATDLVYVADDAGVALPHPDPVASGHLPDRPKVHHGRIGSADRSLRNLAERDVLAARHNLRAIEMEATGVGKASFADGREWFIVRGISDYGDRRTGGVWRKYAALVAAAYTKALLGEVPSLELRGDRFRLPEK